MKSITGNLLLFLAIVGVAINTTFANDNVRDSSGVIPEKEMVPLPGAGWVDVGPLIRDMKGVVSKIENINVITLPHGTKMAFTNKAIDYTEAATDNHKDYRLKKIDDGFEIGFYGNECTYLVLRGVVNGKPKEQIFKLCTYSERE